jgi:hypothetical protein
MKSINSVATSEDEGEEAVVRVWYAVSEAAHEWDNK